MREWKNEEATGAKDREARHAPAEAWHPRSRLLALQGTVGNAAVVQVLRPPGHGLGEEEHRHGTAAATRASRTPPSSVLRPPPSSAPPFRVEGNVVRGDSKHMYESFGGILKQQESHPDGGYVSRPTRRSSGRRSCRPRTAIRLTHTYVAGKEIVDRPVRRRQHTSPNL
jgi:hypothetical protein